ncbi:hypothetical protein [Gordonia alkaliphila]|uniref:Scaffolding protein n=1 Tax=Gordonia alkaliphila TaxID=1053547 RepID=A0ABP8ZGA1_9ACTN
MSKQQWRLRFIEGGDDVGADGGGGGGNPPASSGDGGEGTEPVQLPDDHPLVKTLAAQKSEIADLKAKVTESVGRETELQGQVDGIEQSVAGKVRDALVGAYGIADDAAALITATTTEDVVKQINTVLALGGDPGKPGAPKLGTTHSSPPSDTAAFASALFGGTDS